MTTRSIKLNTYTGQVKIINNNDLNKRIFDIMMLVFGILALFYFIFLANMVWNIVERKSLESYANTLGNEVGRLELEYLSLSEKVDLSLAHSLGFVEPDAKYATRQTLGAVVIINNEI